MGRAPHWEYCATVLLCGQVPPCTRETIIDPTPASTETCPYDTANPEACGQNSSGQDVNQDAFLLLDV